MENRCFNFFSVNTEVRQRCSYAQKLLNNCRTISSGSVCQSHYGSCASNSKVPDLVVGNDRVISGKSLEVMRHWKKGQSTWDLRSSGPKSLYNAWRLGG